MPRALPLLLGPLLLLGLGLKLDRAMTQSLAPQAAATQRLVQGLVAGGWQPLAETPLLADGSLAAQGFARGACRLEVALLPPGPEHLAVLREAWGARARFLDGAELQAAPPEAWRWRHLFGHLRHAAGLGPRPSLFALAAASQGACPAGLWEELSALRPG